MIKVLHVAAMLGSGGVEKWLVDLVQEMGPKGCDATILVLSPQVGVHGRRADAAGLRVIRVLELGHPLRFAIKFRRILKQYGPFDVVHSHVHYFSGIVLSIAKLAGVPVRVAHAHNDTSQEPNGIVRRLYRRVSQVLIRLSASRAYGVSDASARDLLGDSYGKDLRWGVLPCGIYLEAYRESYRRNEIRRELGVPSHALVLAQVGRLTWMKNQEFSLDIVRSMMNHGDAARPVYLLLLGEGPLEESYRAKASQLGIKDRILFLGARADVPRLLCGAADTFLFPSLAGEGAPIALVEAQAAALPCFISEHIPASCTVVPSIVRRLPLRAGAEAWATAIEEEAAKTDRMSRADAASAVDASAFNVRRNGELLEAVYRSRL